MKKNFERKEAVAIIVHPLQDSLLHYLFHEFISVIKNVANVTICDLYSENFNGIMDAQERKNYHQENYIPNDVSQYIELLKNCSLLIIFFPTWCGGPPALLKGFFDRILKPGVSFKILSDGKLESLQTFSNVKQVYVFNTHGGSLYNAIVMGNYSRKLFTRGLKWNFGSVPLVKYRGVYDVNKISVKKIDHIKIILQDDASRIIEKLNTL